MVVKVEMTITTAGVTGQEIIDAVKALAKEGFVEEMSVVDDDMKFTVGRSSEFPYQDLIIHADGRTEIDPHARYTKISVIATEWPGEKYAVGYGDEAVVKAMREFRDWLREKLVK